MNYYIIGIILIIAGLGCVVLNIEQKKILKLAPIDIPHFEPQLREVYETRIKNIWVFCLGLFAIFCGGGLVYAEYTTKEEVKENG